MKKKKMRYILQRDFIMSGKTWASTDGCVCMRRPRSSSFTGKKINMKQSFLIAILELVLFTSASSSSQVAPLYDVTMLNDASLICIKSLPGKAGYLFIYFYLQRKSSKLCFCITINILWKRTWAWDEQEHNCQERWRAAMRRIALNTWST